MVETKTMCRIGVSPESKYAGACWSLVIRLVVI